MRQRQAIVLFQWHTAYFKRCQSHSIPIVLDIYNKGNLAFIQRIEASIQCSNWLEQRGRRWCLEYLVYAYNAIYSIPMLRGKAKHCTSHVMGISTKPDGCMMGAQTSRQYNALLSLFKFRLSGLFKGVVYIVAFKMTRTWTRLLSKKTRILAPMWSYNWIVLWYLSCHHKQWTCLFPESKANYPATLYSVTQWSHICII